VISCEIIIFYAPKYDSNASSKFSMLTLCLYKADIRRKHSTILANTQRAVFSVTTFTLLALVGAAIGLIASCHHPSDHVQQEDRDYYLDRWFGVPLEMQFILLILLCRHKWRQAAGPDGVGGPLLQGGKCGHV